MAKIYTVHCEDCNVEGPLLRTGQATRPFAYVASRAFQKREPAAEIMWADFLARHEYHDLRLTGPQ